MKNALDDLREIVPGVSEATDAASLCELTVEYTRQRNKALVAKYGNVGAHFLQRLSVKGGISLLVLPQNVCCLLSSTDAILD